MELEWSEEEVESAWTAWRTKSAPHVPEKALSDAMRRVMTRAVELAAARGGTMTAEEIAAATADTFSLERMKEHIASIGARNAVLEAKTKRDERFRDEAISAREEMKGMVSAARAEVERLKAEALQLRSALDRLDCTHREGGDTRHCRVESPCVKCEREAIGAEIVRLCEQIAARNVAMDESQQQIDFLRAELAALKPSGQVAEDAEKVRDFIDATLEVSPPEGKEQEVIPAFSRLATMAQRAERAEQAESVWRKRVEDAAAALAEVATGEVGRLDLVAKVKHLLDRCTTLSAAGQVLSAHVDKASACAGEPDCGWHNGGPCSACKAIDVAECDHSHGGIHIRADGVEVCVECDEPIRYPCSPTCTHDDAANPGHPERVKERSEAVKDSAYREARTYNDGKRHGFTDGAETMRAACLEAVQDEKDDIGLTTYQTNKLKAAIEQAKP